MNGILLPSIKLLHPQPEVGKFCDIAAIASTSAHYTLSKKMPLKGFDYIEELSRKLNIRRLRNTITCLIPKALKSESNINHEIVT